MPLSSGTAVVVAEHLAAIAPGVKDGVCAAVHSGLLHAVADGQPANSPGMTNGACAGFCWLGLLCNQL